MRKEMAFLAALMIGQAVANDYYKVSYKDGHSIIIPMNYCEKNYGGILSCYGASGDIESFVAAFRMNEIEDIEIAKDSELEYEQRERRRRAIEAMQ